MSDQKKAIIITLVTLVAIAAFMGYDFLQKKNIPKQCTIPTYLQNLSPNILSITRPVTTYTGFVEKIEGNIITVNQYGEPLIAHSLVLSPTPSTERVNMKYKVTITPKTPLVQIDAMPFYLFKVEPTKTQPTPITLKDIQVGSTITFETGVDLRTLKSMQFEAMKATVTKKTYTYIAEIDRIEGNTLLMHTVVLDSQTGNFVAKEFEVLADENITEVSHFNSQDEKPPQKAIQPDYSELKYGMQITLYTDKDINEGSEVTALRIDPELNGPVIPTPHN